MKALSLHSPTIFSIQGRVDFNRLLDRHDAKQVLFIITPSVQKKILFSPKQGMVVAGYGFLKEDLDNEIRELRHITKIVAVGASKILDQAKYIASQLNIPLVVIPSILSTNAFSTEKSVLKVSEKSISVDAKVPDEVYIIDQLLKMAPQKYNKFGLIDILSIYTALKDWDIATKEGKASYASEYYLAQGVLDALSSGELAVGDYYNTAKLLLHSGLVVGSYGDGRPESGSEHIIAKAIESKITCFHAYSVSFGMLVAMKLQGSWRKDIVAMARNIPDWDSRYGKNILAQIEKSLSCKDIKPRQGRYTILDKVNGKKIEHTIEKVIRFLKT